MGIRHNTAEQRFETDTPAGIALIAYERRPGTLVLTHTEVPPEAREQGIGGSLVQAALDYAAGANVKVIPRCPFALAYVKRHPELHDRVVESFRNRLS